MFTIKAWERESHDKEDDVYGTTQRVQDAIEAAKILSRSNDAVEIFNGEEMIYSISHDPEDPEKIIVKNNTSPMVIPSIMEDAEEIEGSSPSP